MKPAQHQIEPTQRVRHSARRLPLATLIPMNRSEARPSSGAAMIQLDRRLANPQSACLATLLRPGTGALRIRGFKSAPPQTHEFTRR